VKGDGFPLTKKNSHPQGKKEKDYFGLSLSGGDRYGEIIPSMFAWLPPDEQRRRVGEIMEMSSEVSLNYEAKQAKEGQGVAKKKKKKQDMDPVKERAIEQAKTYETMRPQLDDDPEPHG